MTKKIGRPTTNPKPHKITIRLDEEAKAVLDQYCEQEKVNQMEATRRGIKKLKGDIKK
jgi:Ribbon-helix-helix protein, copG family.